jgi:hypothetical protein
VASHAFIPEMQASPVLEMSDVTNENDQSSSSSAACGEKEVLGIIGDAPDEFVGDYQGYCRRHVPVDVSCDLQELVLKFNRANQIGRRITRSKSFGNGELSVDDFCGIDGSSMFVATAVMDSENLPSQLLIGVDVEGSGSGDHPVMEIGFVAVDPSKSKADGLDAVVWRMRVMLPFMREHMEERCLNEFWLKDKDAIKHLKSLENWWKPYVKNINPTNISYFEKIRNAAVCEMYVNLADLLAMRSRETSDVAEIKFVSDNPEFDIGKINGLFNSLNLPSLNYRPMRQRLFHPEFEVPYIGQCISLTEWLRVFTCHDAVMGNENNDEFIFAVGINPKILGVEHTHDPVEDAQYVALQYRRIALTVNQMKQKACREFDLSMEKHLAWKHKDKDLTISIAEDESLYKNEIIPLQKCAYFSDIVSRDNDIVGLS